jgi:hypothetical protein
MTWHRLIGGGVVAFPATAAVVSPTAAIGATPKAAASAETEVGTLSTSTCTPGSGTSLPSRCRRTSGPPAVATGLHGLNGGTFSVIYLG